MTTKSPEELAAQALEQQRSDAMKYSRIQRVEALEALRRDTAEGKDREALDHVILMRKRSAKGAFEAMERWADLFDKAALPAAAAVPALATFLSAERVLIGPARFPALLASYLFGAGLWWFCRWMAFRRGQRARLGLARLGKVD